MKTRHLESELMMLESQVYQGLLEVLSKYEFQGFSAPARAQILSHKVSEECREWIYACEELRSKTLIQDPNGNPQGPLPQGY